MRLFDCTFISPLHLQCEELLEIIAKEHWPWFSQYVVVRRLSIEPNFHTLYANFVDATKVAELIDTVVREVHRNIQVRPAWQGLYFQSDSRIISANHS